MMLNTRETHVEALVRRIKSDINMFIQDGVIPPTVASFPELHDYLDANTLGDTETISEDMEWVEFIAICNEAFSGVDAWLKEETLRHHLSWGEGPR